MSPRSAATRRPAAFDRLEDRRLLTLTMNGASISAIQQQAFNGVVAVVGDTNIRDTPASFNSVTIDWGDGQTSTGQVVGPVTFGVFQVVGNHTYAQAQPRPYTTLISVTTISGANASAVGSATVAAPPFLVAVNAISAAPGDLVPADGIVATFLSPSAADNAPSDFSALINWGDGQTTIGTIQGGPTAFNVIGSHVYALAGSYTISVTVAPPSGPSSTATGLADILPPFSPTSRLIVVPVSQVFSGTVATFTDPNTSDVASDFTASIAWGDGGTTPGTVTGSNGTFAIQGTYTYTSAGTYAATITVADPTGATFTVVDTATVTTQGVPGTGATLTGGLADAPANGPHSAAGFTNTDRPIFSGTATPFAIVQLYARHVNVDAQLPLGEAVADAQGRWTLTTGPLAVGTYIVSATVTIPGGYPSNLITLTNANGTDLVYIDLTPKLVRWLSHGQRAVAHHHPGPRATHLRMPTPPGRGPSISRGGRG
jgi:hypothetical protein